MSAAMLFEIAIMLLRHSDKQTTDYEGISYQKDKEVSRRLKSTPLKASRPEKACDMKKRTQPTANKKGITQRRRQHFLLPIAEYGKDVNISE
ncbi:hypothetical protein [Rhizobium sp. PAMB 3182]